MTRTRHYRDLLAWQKAMDLAREVYLRTEEFPNSETFGLRMQMRRSSTAIPSHIADGHGRLTDVDFRKSLSAARGALNELQTQTELAASLQFIRADSSQFLIELGTEVGKLISGLLGVLSNT